jgi:multiple sugar transport system substrate-binding protein
MSLHTFSTPLKIKSLRVAASGPAWGVALLLFLTLVLSACGDTATPTPSVASTTIAGTNSSGSNTGVVTLTFGWWSNSPEKDRAWLDSYAQSHPNIKIKSEFLGWDQYWSNINTTTVAGTAYDLIGLCTCAIANILDNGNLLNLNQFPDLGQVTANLADNTAIQFNWNKKQYALPVGIALGLLGYNKDLFQAAGIPPPDSTAEMEKQGNIVLGVRN